MNGKAATQSLTIISAFMALVAGVLDAFNITIDAPLISQNINDLFIIAGTIGAIYGRKRAQGPITSLMKKDGD